MRCLVDVEVSGIGQFQQIIELPFAPYVGLEIAFGTDTDAEYVFSRVTWNHFETMFNCLLDYDQWLGADRRRAGAHSHYSDQYPTTKERMLSQGWEFVIGSGPRPEELAHVTT
jgi:hypothetical protein